MAQPASYLNTYIPLPTNSGSSKNSDNDSFLSLVPIHIVTNASQLPKELRRPSPERQLVIGFDSEGVNLSRHGTLCILQIATSDAIYIVDAINGGKDLMNACKPALESAYITKVIHDCKRDSEALYFQFGIKLHNVVDTQIAYSLLQEQLGLGQPSDDCISFIGLLADRRFCGISYLEKKEVCFLLQQDPRYWTYRPFTEQMIHAAVDDVRFLPYIHHKIMEKLNEQSMWKLAVRGALYCRCFCVTEYGFADWPPIPSVPGDFFMNGKVPEEEILSVVDVPSGKMGCIIGKKGASIQYVKQSCKAQIIIGGDRGPYNKVFIIGPATEARKGEALLRGLLDHTY
ncbi:exosome complex exonuclease rrp6-like isoform X1 [Silene latifolia]|uniref:exosome complex exonuclease rrp6-like isoform X1 n=1 Tax=Silene latifolia TaxID=37657 RepID=UPI003D77ECA3